MYFANITSPQSLRITHDKRALHYNVQLKKKKKTIARILSVGFFPPPRSTRAAHDIIIIYFDVRFISFFFFFFPHTAGNRVSHRSVSMPTRSRPGYRLLPINLPRARRRWSRTRRCNHVRSNAILLRRGTPLSALKYSSDFRGRTYSCPVTDHT